MFAASCCGAKEDTNWVSRLEPVPPFPELRTAAKTAGIPLDGFNSSTNSQSLSPGDSVTTLITLHQKGNHRTQWLVYFQVVTVSNEPPEKPTVLYNSLGHKFEFAHAPATFRIRTLGPYVDTVSFWGTPVAKDDYGSASVNEAFLGLGLDKSAAALYRISMATEEARATNFNPWVYEKPPPAKQTERNQKLAVALHITPEEELAFASWYPTLMSYFTTVGETPNLEGIMWKVVNLPSLWSIVRHGGITAWMGIGVDKVRPISLSAWDLPTHSPAYTLPMKITLNQQPTLDVKLIVADPQPPLLACGGIVGFLAQNPVDDQNYLTLRVISAHCSHGVSKKQIKFPANLRRGLVLTEP
jgi:hypothetical protein